MEETKTKITDAAETATIYLKNDWKVHLAASGKDMLRAEIFYKGRLRQLITMWSE
jgi:hypothetical protein